MAMMMIMVDVLWWIMDVHVVHGCCNKNVVVDEEKEMRNMRMMMRKSEKQS